MIRAMTNRLWMVLIVLGLMLPACRMPPQASLAVVPMMTPTTVPQVLAQSPAATPTAQPPARLSKTGPWLIIRTSKLWAANSDGSAVTPLTPDKIFDGNCSLDDLASIIAPAGGRIALIPGSTCNRYQDMTLKLITLADGQMRTITALFPPGKQVSPDARPGDPTLEAARAIGDNPALAWSPDGSQLAFIGAQDGPSADLYSYSVATGKITRLTDGPSQAYMPSWSPDGRYIVHLGTGGFGTGAGHDTVGAWAARADGSGVTTLWGDKRGGEKVEGWVGSDTVVTSIWRAQCGDHKLETLAIPDGPAKSLWPTCFDQFALDPASGTAMIAVVSDTARLSQDTRYGAFLIPAGEAPRQMTADEHAQIAWSPEGKVFLIRAGQTVSAVQPSGSVIPLPNSPAALPVAAPGGKVWAWASSDAKTPGVWIGALASSPTQVFNKAAFSLSWSPDGQTLAFVADGIYVAHAPDYVPVRLNGNVDVSDKTSIAWAR